MLTFSIGMFAQEAAKSNWTVGSQESSFPGEIIKYAVCPCTNVIEGKADPITVTLRVMIFKGKTTYMLVSKGDEFIIDDIQSQKVLIKFDDEKASNYSLVGNNTYSATTLVFDGTYKNKFKGFLKKGKKCKMDVEFKDNGAKTIEFNVEGLDAEFLQ